MATASVELFDPYPASGAQIREVAEQGSAGLGALEDLEGDVNSAHRPTVDAVEGDITEYVQSAPGRASEYNQALQMKVSFAKGALHMFALAVDNFDLNSADPRSISKLNLAYKEALNNDFGLNHADYEQGGTKANGDYSDDWVAAMNTAIAGLKKEHGRLETQLDGEAQEVSGMLQRGPNEADVQAMYAAGALPSYANLLFPGYDLSGISFDRLPTDLADMTDEELANYLLEHPDYDPNIMLNLHLLAPEVVDIMGSKIADQLRDADIQWDTDTETLQHYANLLQTWQDASLNITASIYENLGAEGALQFLEKINSIAANDTSDDALSLATTFRHGLTLADTMWSEAERTQFGTNLGQALADSQGEQYDYKDEMAFLLHDQYYSTALLDPLADKIASLDISEHALDTNMSVGALDQGAASNVTQALFSALGKNGEASLNFFDDPERQELYLNDRNYSATYGYEDLLSALDAATTDEGNVDDPQRRDDAARLVSSLSHYLGSNDDFVNNGGFGEGASHIAHILSTYMPAVDYYIAHAGESAPNVAPGFGDERLGQWADMPVFGHSQLENLVKVAVSNEDGLTDMRVGLSTYQQANLAAGIEDGYINQNNLDADAQLEGFFIKQVGETDIQEAVEDDARIQAWIDLGKDVAGLIPLPGAETVGEGGAKLIEFLAGQTTNVTADAFHDHFETNTQAACEDADQMAQDALNSRRIAIASVLVENDQISMDELAASAESKGVSQEQIDNWFGDGSLPDPSQMSPEERQEYENTINDVIEEADPQDPSGPGWADMARYKGEYIDVFTPFFPEKGHC